MSSKPILFNTEMVKAILDGRKTQTRRIVLKDFMEIEIDKDVMPQKVEFINFKRYCPSLNFKDDGNAVFRLVNRDIKPLPFFDGICREIDVRPRYKVGDILYVREPVKVINYDFPSIGDILNNEAKAKDWVMWYKYLADDKENEIVIPERFIYDCTIKAKWITDCNGVPNGCIKEMARIFLKVTNIRVERLQDITTMDIQKEGINILGLTQNLIYQKWEILWDSTAKKGYRLEDNPYVFVYEFERIEKQ